MLHGHLKQQALHLEGVELVPSIQSFISDGESQGVTVSSLAELLDIETDEPEIAITRLVKHFVSKSLDDSMDPPLGHFPMVDISAARKGLLPRMQWGLTPKGIVRYIETQDVSICLYALASDLNPLAMHYSLKQLAILLEDEVPTAADLDPDLTLDDFGIPESSVENAIFGAIRELWPLADLGAVERYTEYWVNRLTDNFIVSTAYDDDEPPSIVAKSLLINVIACLHHRYEAGTTPVAMT